MKVTSLYKMKLEKKRLITSFFLKFKAPLRKEKSSIHELFWFIKKKRKCSKLTELFSENICYFFFRVSTTETKKKEPFIWLFKSHLGASSCSLSLVRTLGILCSVEISAVCNLASLNRASFEGHWKNKAWHSEK